MDSVVESELKKRKIRALRATGISGHKDYLDKIVQTIRGCGFGIVVFSKATPASTLANVFFEAGIALLIGKPVIIVKTSDTVAPSDFVRTEWVDYSLGKKSAFRANLARAIGEILRTASFWEKLADTALEAEDTDYDLAFERYKQSLLIANEKRVRNRIQSILNILKNADADHPMNPNRKKLVHDITHFLNLLP